MKAMMFVALAGLAATSAAAQPVTTSSQPAATAKRANDPNRMICEREDEIGSRLGGKKVCKTAAQWDEQRRVQRETVEGVQRQATSTGIPAG